MLDDVNYKKFEKVSFVDCRDENGNLVERHGFSASGTLVCRYTYTTNKIGLCVELQNLDRKGNPFQRVINQYNNKGFLQKMLWYHRGELIRQIKAKPFKKEPNGVELYESNVWGISGKYRKKEIVIYDELGQVRKIMYDEVKSSKFYTKIDLIEYDENRQVQIQRIRIELRGWSIMVSTRSSQTSMNKETTEWYDKFGNQTCYNELLQLLTK